MVDYARVLAEFTERRRTIDVERAELDTAIASIERIVSSVSGRAAQPPTQTEARSVTPRAFATLTMPQAVTKYLRLVQQPQTKRQIQDALRSGGTRAGAGFSAHVYNTLRRLNHADGPYYKEADGRWGLREWQTARADSGNASQPGGATH